MKIKLLFFATLLAFTSCSTSDDEIPVSAEISQPISIKPNKISWNFPNLASSVSGSDPNYYFQYDSQGRVTKKIGGIMQMPGGTGVSDFFSNSLYTDITYNGNTASTGTYSSNTVFNPPLKARLFEFDSQGRIIKAVIYAQYIEWEEHLSYTYDATGKLVEIFTQLPNMPYFPTDPSDYILTYVEKFTYDAAGNLQKAVKTERHNNIDAFVMKEIEYSNFDTAQNPFKSLAIFDDYLYLSLSNNNPQKRVARVFQQGNGFTFNQQDWTNQYDSNANLKLYY